MFYIATSKIIQTLFYEENTEEAPVQSVIIFSPLFCLEAIF